MTNNDILIYIKEHPELSNRKIALGLSIDKSKVSKLRKENGLESPNKRLTENQKNYIINNAHKSSTILSKELNIPASTIRGLWQRNNINKKKIFNPNVDEFIKLYDEYNSSRKLARIYGFDRVTILNFARKIGYDNSIELKFNDEEVKYICSMYYKTSAEKLSEKLNCSGSLISKIWSENGLTGKDNRTFYSNFDYFETIDSYDKAYFLGFIGADGCVYDRNEVNRQKSLSICIHRKDEYILDIFRKCIDSNNKILRNEYYTDNNVLVETSTIVIVSDKMCDDLSKYEIVPRKTWTFKVKNIPDKYMWHFIRGFFDGDGSISKNKKSDNPSDYSMSFVGNKYTMSFIHDYLSNHNIKSSLLKCKEDNYANDFYQLTINNINSRYLLIEYLYENCGEIYLPRKKQLADHYIKICHENKTKRVYLDRLPVKL